MKLKDTSWDSVYMEVTIDHTYVLTTSMHTDNTDTCVYICVCVD